MKINKTMQLALIYYRAGNLQQTINLLEEILCKQPDDSEILKFLGIIYAQLENYDLAVHYFLKTLQCNSNEPDACLALGNIYMSQKRFHESIQYFKKVLEINPNSIEAYHYLAHIFSEQKQCDEAIVYVKKALHINPDNADSYFNLGLLLQQKGNSSEAIECYKKVLQINSHAYGAYNNIGMILHENEKPNEATYYYQKALECNPSFYLTHLNLGKALYDQGKNEQAMAAFDVAISLNPHDIAAYFARCMSQLFILYQNKSSLALSRRRYHEKLTKLRETIPLKTPQDIEAAASAVGSSHPFFLAYQGLNDKELQQQYGELVHRIMTARYPHFADRPAIPLRGHGEPLRVGFVSAFFHTHSNWKLPIKGWIENLTTQKFHLYGYFTGKIKDDVTKHARTIFHRFVEDTYSFEDLCRIILKDNLHILIYPAINMDQMTIKLAALRLAPIQCASWGHPDTTGLPTIDYYLSSALMEPPDADDHYTEHLIRLPNLSIYYTPLDIPEISVSRNDFGIREKSIAYLCCQNLCKYLPQYDEIYPRIAKKVKNCQFVFITFKRSESITEAFRSRVKHTFQQFNMNADDYLVFLPVLDAAHYLALNRLADVYLDSIGWSGCNSTLEAISCNLPIVTLPGNLMRGRHSAAILTMMGLTETIASSLDEYIELAVRLGVDPEWRKQISNTIDANKHRAYRDTTCIHALEDFLETVVREKLHE
jgi:protein O-GlcNAc transferase